jgi:hypothetical protein
VVAVYCEPVSDDFPVIGEYTRNFHAFPVNTNHHQAITPYYSDNFTLLGSRPGIVNRESSGNSLIPEELALVTGVT